MSKKQWKPEILKFSRTEIALLLPLATILAILVGIVLLMLPKALVNDLLNF